MRRIWPVAVQTVGAMRDAQADGRIHLKMICGRCDGVYKVPVRLIGAACGTGYSLIGRRVTCPAYGCEGNCVVLFKMAGTNPFVSLSV